MAPLRFYIVPRLVLPAAMIVVLGSATSATLRSQEAELRSDTLASTLSCFAIPGMDSVRVDVYCSAPYAALTFVPNKRQWAASYQLRLSMKSLLNGGLTELKTDYVVQEQHGDPAIHMKERRDITQNVLTLLPGQYHCILRIRDALSGRELESQFTAQIDRFNPNVLSLSSLLYLSSVEERDGRTVITPFVGDDLSSMGDGFFVFAECYSKNPDEAVSFRCELYDRQARIWSGAAKSIQLHSGANQIYLRVQLPSELSNGQYVLRCVALRSTRDTVPLAQSERTLHLHRAMRGALTADLDKVVRYMRYVATQEEMDAINAGASPQDRRRRFEEFWQRQDPSPGTQRNEAFEEYYTRVEYANKNFQSYVEGWLSDMGMVYIVLGAPDASRRQMSTDGRSYIQWSYAAPPRQFLFIDYTSFGDYRLSTSTPFSSIEKYHYHR